MSDQIHKELAIEIAPGLAVEAARRYFEARGRPPEGWGSYSRVFERIAPRLLELPPRSWTRSTSRLGQGLGAIDATQDSRAATGMVLAAFAYFAEVIHGREADAQRRVSELVGLFGDQFGLTPSMREALHKVLPSISTALYSTYVAYLYTPETGRTPVSLHESEKDQRKLREYLGAYRLVVDDAAGQVFADKVQVAIPGTGYEYEIIVLLMQRAGDRWPLGEIQRRLMHVHEVFRHGDEDESVQRESVLLDRIGGQWSTLLRGLRRRLGSYGELVQSESGHVRIAAQLSTCLILHGNSRFLKRG